MGCGFIEKYCRMCALELKQGVFIFGEEGKRLQIPEKIRKTVSILVLEEDNLPKKICTDCCSSIEDYSQYKDTVLDAQEKLTAIARNSEKSQEPIHPRRSQNLRDKPKPQISAQALLLPSPGSPSCSVDDSEGLECNYDEGNLESPEASRDEKQESPTCSKGTNLERLQSKISEESPLQPCESNSKVLKRCQLVIPSPSKSSTIPVVVIVKDKETEDSEEVCGLQCGLCGFSSKDKEGIEIHHQAQHDIQKYQSPVYGCPMCPRITENYNAIRIHIYRHRAEGTFKCLECVRTFPVKDQLDRHMLSSHNPGGKAFSCKLCGKRFSAKCSLVVHMTTKHPVTNEDTLLSIDTSSRVVEEKNKSSTQSPQGEDQSFHDNDDVGVVDESQENQQEEQTVDKNIASPPPENQITVAKETGSHDDYDYATSKSYDADKGIWKCEYCDKIFQSCFGYKCHVQTHKGKRFACEQCNTVFTQKGSLQHHMISRHSTSLQEHQCEICPKKFATKKHLKLHEKIHTEPHSEYTCSVCEKKYKSALHLKFHSRTHNQSKNFICSMCGKSFMNQIKLDNHKNTHTGKKPFNCSHCDYATSGHGAYYRHLKTHDQKIKLDKKTKQLKNTKQIQLYPPPKNSSGISVVSDLRKSLVKPSTLLQSSSNVPTTLVSTSSLSQSQSQIQIQPVNTPQQLNVNDGHSSSVINNNPLMFSNHGIEGSQTGSGINYSQQHQNSSNSQQTNNQQLSNPQMSHQNMWQTSLNIHPQPLSNRPFQNNSTIQPSTSASNIGINGIDLVDCAIQNTLTIEDLSSPAHNLSHTHTIPHDYSPSHHNNNNNHNTSVNHQITNHGHGTSNMISQPTMTSSVVSNAHSSSAPPIAASTSSSLIISSSHHNNGIHNINSRSQQIEPMELSYKLQIDNSGFQDMPMELTKVFQRDPLELCVRQDFNQLMDLSSRVSGDGSGLNLNSIHMNNGMNSSSGMGMNNYHKLDIVDRELSFSDLSGAFRQPIDLIARSDDSHELCSEGNLVDLSLRSSFVQDQSASSFLRELIDLSARSDSFHGELNLTNKQNHQSNPGSHTNLQNLSSNQQHNNNNNNGNSNSNPGSKSNANHHHHGNGTGSFQNVIQYHDAIFGNIQN